MRAELMEVPVMSDRSIEERLRALEDRAEIADLLGRYAFAIDRLRWDDFLSCFAEEVEVNLIRTGGWRTMKSSELARVVEKVFTSYTATQHISANPQIAIEGDRAVAWSTLNATHYLRDATGDPWHQQVGYYEYTLARLGAGWRIVRMQQIVHWQRGNQQIYDRTVTS
ncbi:nuclear transport factor 2 family protein [Microbacterium sp. RD1]|uniref:nuclear transport factor 2 family protein n=1 Tax=Microbacterium sp. RD1 TaxID=3457313 RepID=UPI003FA57A26